MTQFIRRFRGLGVAVVVLALSAGAVFASSAGLSMRPASAPQTADQTQSDEPSEAAGSQDPSEAPESEAPETEDASQAANTAAPTDTHGALVSTAAQMDTPAGFANHGAFVSCVAHMTDATLATIDWTKVTPEACAAANPNQASATGNAKSEAGKAKGQAGRAKGAAHRAAAQAAH